MTKSLYAFLSNSWISRKLAALATPHKAKTKAKYAPSPEKESADDIDDENPSLSVKISTKFADYAKRCEKFLDEKLWTVLSVVCTITSLLAYDFTIAFLPKSVDISTDIILLIVFAFFFIELIVASLVRKGYFLSFWFWLDFIAMVSMIPDLALLLSLFGAGDGEINVANTQASKAGKSGRSAVALKAIRMIRFSRLLRVLRVFKYFQTEDEDDSYDVDPVDAGSSKVGQIVSESVTKKVIILVLVLVLVLPWMSPSGASYSESATTASLLFKTCVENFGHGSVGTLAALSVFEGVGVPVLKIVIDGEDVVNSAAEIALRRPVEVWGLSLDKLGLDESADYILFDIRANVLEEAALGMCLTFFAILIFASSTLFVTASTMSLVVAPVARLTELLTKMAGVIGLLGGAQTVENMMEDNDELFIVEALCERIMDIFGTGGSSQPCKSGTRKKGSKALSMMATRKITQITSGDRVWEIDVTEKHRTSVIERRVNRSFKEFKHERSKVSQLCIDEENEEDIDDVDDVEALSELASLRQIVDNPITLYCLRMFMTSNLSINNLLFVLEAEEWAMESRNKFKTLFAKYVDDKSAAQINLTATQFGKLNAVETGKEALSEDVFEDAVFETWELMERNIFHQFLDSDFCRFYLFMKQNDPLTLNQLQLSVPEEEYDDNVERQMIRNSGSVDSGR